MAKRTSAEVINQLVAAGLQDYTYNLKAIDHTVFFNITEAGLDLLTVDPRFASGVFYAAHTQVGTDLIDFRSFNGTFGKGSLQIVVDKKTYQAYADVDRFNPYQDVVSFVGHTFAEVIPNWFKKVFKGR